MIPHLTDFAASRTTLLGAAEAAGATLASYQHPLPGPSGEALSTDTARFGAPVGEAHTVVLVSSGLHGVEGHAGNGLQQLLIASGRLVALPTGVAVVLIHAVNPYGMAWSRRVDHQNIDVNRNFVDFTELPTNERYAEVDEYLNPTGDVLDLDDTSYLEPLLEFWTEAGDAVAFHTISGGQYTRPRGVQFGGQEASWSRRTLEQIWSDHLIGANEAVALDLHTGLGPLGRLTVFQTADEHEPAARAGSAWFPEWIFRSNRDTTVDHGVMGPGFDGWADENASGRAPRPLETSAFVLEFGTHDPITGVGVFRADNWLHNHGEPTSELGLAIGQRMRDFFFVEDEGWRRDVADTGMTAIHAALDGVTG